MDTKNEKTKNGWQSERRRAARRTLPECERPLVVSKADRVEPRSGVLRQSQEACLVGNSDSSTGERASRTPFSGGVVPSTRAEMENSRPLLRISPDRMTKRLHLFSLKLSRRGQQVGEYALLIAAVSSALLLMYVFTKRGIQSTIKDLTDHEIGWQNDSVPVLAGGSHHDERSTTVTTARDRMRVRKDPVSGTRYESTSTSVSSGEANITYNEF
jgi:hypothetical protein